MEMINHIAGYWVPLVWFQIGELHLEIGNTVLAIQAFQRAASSDTSDLPGPLNAEIAAKARNNIEVLSAGPATTKPRGCLGILMCLAMMFGTAVGCVGFLILQAQG